MSSNENLGKARSAKNDEFYTQLSDIAEELANYKHFFKDKIVYCNCDDPLWSNFWRYFHMNFTEFGLKKLMSTHYVYADKTMEHVCEADEGQARDRFESEMMQWFTIINVAGEPLTRQELRNAIYSGTWVTDAKTYFSNEKSKIFRDTYSVDRYFKEITKGRMNRQAFLEYMLKYKSDAEGINIETYMSKHRNDISATELFSYFEEVMAWVKKTFNFYDREAMYGQDWCRLYNTYHSSFAKSATDIYTEFNELIEDDEIMKKDGIIEYILSGEPKHLNFRDFDDRVKKEMYKKQGGICPLCQKEAEELEKLEADCTKKKTKAIQFKYELKEMEADHIIPWSHGGKTEPENCCMLCKKHNRVKSDTFDPFIKQYVDSLY